MVASTVSQLDESIKSGKNQFNARCLIAEMKRVDCILNAEMRCHDDWSMYVTGYVGFSMQPVWV